MNGDDLWRSQKMTKNKKRHETGRYETPSFKRHTAVLIEGSTYNIGGAVLCSVRTASAATATFTILVDRRRQIMAHRRRQFVGFGRRRSDIGIPIGIYTVIRNGIRNVIRNGICNVIHRRLHGIHTVMVQVVC